MTDEQLIELVKRYPVLYDMTSNQYRDIGIRNNAWEEIAEQLHCTVEICKERWSKLRNCFTNVLKRRNKKSGQASTKVVSWKYEKQMEFLLSHVEGRKTLTNLSIDIGDNSTQELQFSEELKSPADAIASTSRTPTLSSFSMRTSTPNSFSARTTSKKDNDNTILRDMVNVIKSSHENRQKRMLEMDETDHFFMSMSKNLKKLPKIEQTNIKFQVHKLIHEAEIKILNNREKVLNTPLVVTCNKKIHYKNMSKPSPATIPTINKTKTLKINIHNDNGVTQKIVPINYDMVTHNGNENIVYEEVEVATPERKGEADRSSTNDYNNYLN